MQDTDHKNTLRTPISSLPSLSTEQIIAFSELGIYTVADLIKHLPTRYETHLGSKSIQEAIELLGDEPKTAEIIAIEGTIAEVSKGWRRGRNSKIEVLIEDHSGTLCLNWFNQPWIAKSFHPEMRIRVFGTLTTHKETVQMNNPRWEFIDASDEEEQCIVEGALRPVYPSKEGLSSTVIAGLIDDVLSDAIEEIDDHFDDADLKSLEMIGLKKAYKHCHAPEELSQVEQGRRRIAFDELFLLQLGVMMKRHHRRGTTHAPALKWNEEIKTRIESRIHFDLTDAQQRVIQEIASDVTTTVPMNRLLQGDVGSGKTVVALHAMLMAVTSGAQAALMAPTELLAEQHFKSIHTLLEGSKVNVALLTSSLGSKERAELVDRIATGDIDLVIGTHAILTHDIVFSNIAIAITDEQHRFGVHQRATLRNKTDKEATIPHTLVMTATPIPRTLSLTLFGDLDVSTINALPPGRKPIKTRLVDPKDAAKVYGFAKDQIVLGRQCYVVVPLVEESAGGMKSVIEHAKELQDHYFSDCTVDVVHGRMKSEEREHTMNRFRTGAIDLLVATTVIEVGVDVQNATLMIIEHADRFGLAQLHQLRGRVGRGEHGGVCALIAAPTTDDAIERLNAIVNTTDGFKIAEKDLEIRGPGELFGAKQSGIAPFKVAKLPRDVALLQLARSYAIDQIETDPYLEQNTLLQKRLLKKYGASLGLGDVA